MGVIATTLKHLIAAGVTGDALVDAIAEIEDSRPKRQSKPQQEELFLPEWLPLEEWNDFVAMRVNIKQPMTSRAAKKIIKKLDKFRLEGKDIIAILEQSETNNWRDVFPLRANLPKDNQDTSWMDKYV